MKAKQNKMIKRSDEELREEVLDLLFKNYSIDASAIEVEVSGRVVTLKGFVKSEEEIKEAQRCVVNWPGVREVRSFLLISRFKDRPLSQTGFETGFS